MLQNKSILFALIFVAVLFGFLFYQAQGIEGGQDSWQHFLISKYALKYPNLLLDQWNKPVFTWFTVLVCQMGMKALIIFNICSVLLSGLFISLALKNKNVANAWLAFPFLCFLPIVFGNTISCLTEPFNLLLLSLIFYLWFSGKLKTAIAITSFLPFVRTEGFVICGAFFLIIIFQKQYKLLFWLLIGSFILNIAGYALTGKLFWIITENPYLKFEQEGQFDPGNGGLLYYINQSRALFGLPILSLFILGNILWLASFKNKSLKNKLPNINLLLLVFWFYFSAHTLIYYFGILGSHGLVRVMAVIAPCIVITSIYSFNFLIEFLPSSKLKKWIIPMIFACIIIHVGYKENNYAKPYHIKAPTVKNDLQLKNFEQASQFIKRNNLMTRTIIHQLPAFNVLMNKDPYDPKSSYYIWSINKQDDWAEIGVIVVWDGFYSTREGNMPLEWLANNPNYKSIYSIEGYEKPTDNPTRYDIKIFEKVSK